MRSCRSLFLIVLMLSVACSYGTAFGQGEKQFAYTGPPAFVIEYPDSYVNDPLQPNEVLRVKAPGGVPSFEIAVFDPPKEGGKLEDHGKNYAKLLEPLGTDVKILSQKPAKLKDDTPAQETTIEWKFQGSIPILSLVVAVMKDNKIVSLGGHTMGNLTPIKEIVQTWEFRAVQPSSGQEKKTEKPAIKSVNVQQTVVGQNNPTADVQAVQAAVSQGGEILLKGTYDFGNEGRVIITKDVKIVGETGPVTKIKGGFWTFHSPLPAKLPPEVPGPKITIQGIHFDGALWSPICLAYSSGATISNNKMTNIKPKASDEPIFGKKDLNSQQGIICYPGFTQPVQTRKYIPNVISGNLIIEDNQIDMINDTPTKTLAHGVFILWTTGIMAKVQRNTIINCSRDSIETTDNYLGQDGRGMILIKDNKITTPQVGVPVPTPGTPNGVVAGWLLDLTGGTDPKRNPKYIITNNSIRARGQMSAGIVALMDGVVIEGNAVATDGPGAAPLYLANGNGFIAHNKIQGTGIVGLVAIPFGPLKASNNLFLENDFTQFKASDADVIFQQGANNNLLLGSSGTVTNRGSGNQITGLKAITK